LRFVLAVLSTAGLASVALVLLILARFTEKWEAVTRKRSYYRLFYVLAGVIVLLGGVHLWRIAALIPDDLTLIRDAQDLLREQTGVASSPIQLRSWLYLFFYYLPLAATMTLSLFLAWRNWGWLLQRGAGPRHRQTDLRRNRQ
jgi:hypothetical protein